MTKIFPLILSTILIPLCAGEIKDGPHILVITTKKADGNPRQPLEISGSLKKTAQRFKFTHIPEKPNPARPEEGQFPEVVFSGKTEGDKITIWSNEVRDGRQIIPILDGVLSKKTTSVAHGKITVLESGREKLQGSWVLYTPKQLIALNQGRAQTDKAKAQDKPAALEDVPAGMEKLGLTIAQAKKINEWLKKNPNPAPRDFGTFVQPILTREQFAELLKID